MALDSSMLSALNGASVRAFHAIRMELPGGTANLLDGSGEVSFSVNGTSTTFTGLDTAYGNIIGISAIEEALATEAPHVTVSILPPNSSAIATLSAVNAQGSAVYIWYGLVNEPTGTVIGNPELIFTGQVDNVEITSNQNALTLSMNIVSVWERLFQPSEGERLNDVSHQYYWSGETGLSQAVGAAAPLQVIWGAAATQPSNTPGYYQPGIYTPGAGIPNGWAGGNFPGSGRFPGGYFG